MSLRILLADDHLMFREALRNLLEKVPGYEVVGETSDGSEVLACAQATGPDLVCMDIGMPRMNGIEATRSLKALLPKVKVIALSTYSERRYVADMLGAGASAYVSKAETSDELLRAVEAVQSDGLYLSPAVARVISGPHATAPAAGAELPTCALGSREREVLRLVASGQTSVEIATKLHIAPSTVEAHRRNLMRKLDLHGVAELTRYAMRCGLLAD
jgi:two-component system NarL family response regulator